MPWLTLTVAIAAGIVTAVPGGGDSVALVREDPFVAWRWWASHLGHFSADHLGWDVLVLVVLGGWLERADRARTGLLYAVGAPVIALGALALAPSIPSYRGLSGIDSALLGAMAVALFRSARTPSERWLPVLLCAAFLAKTVFEAMSGTAVFASSEGWVPVPAAHVLGAVIGAAAWGLGRLSGGASSAPPVLTVARPGYSGSGVQLR